MTNEEFMQPLRKVVNNLKLRASYGVIGNQNITPYSTLPLLSVSSFNFGAKTDFTGYSVSTVATPNLTWEKTHQFDFGVDVSLWNNRIELGVDFFAKHTYDALLQRSQANYVGGLRYWVNAGEITNTGVDLSLTARIVQTNDFQWTSTINGSYNKNKVVKLTAEEPILYGNSPAGGTVDAVSIVKEGEAVGISTVMCGKASTKRAEINIQISTTTVNWMPATAVYWARLILISLWVGTTLCTSNNGNSMLSSMLHLVHNVSTWHAS